MLFQVEVTEILKKAVYVKSDTAEGALEITSEQYSNEIIVLDSGDFQEVSFSIRRVVDDEH